MHPMRHLLNILTESDDDLTLSAIQTFGVTRSYREAGYIIYYQHRAMMLDFSGKHEHNDYEKQDTEYKRGVYPMHVLKRGKKFDDLRDRRFTDHRQITHLEGIVKDGTEAMYEFMRRTGAIRVIAGDGITVATVPPMSMLVMAMRGHRENFGNQPLRVDVVDTADREHDREFSVRYGWEAIQKFIAATLSGQGNAVHQMGENRAN